MNELIICSIVGGIQVVLSINMIVRRKNITAIFSEIISSVLLLCILNYFSNSLNYISLKCVVFTLVEYVSVKFFLIIFMLIARIYSFNKIKEVSIKDKKIGKMKLKIIHKSGNPQAMTITTQIMEHLPILVQVVRGIHKLAII